MTSRLLETLFRHWWLILAAALVIPMVATAITLSTPPLYESTAGVWVQRASYLKIIDGASPYSTPAQTQAGRLAELMRSRTFRADIVRRTPARDEVAREQIDRAFVDGFDIVPVADHLIEIQVRAATASQSLELITATLAAFRVRTTADQANQARVAIAFYQARLTEANDRLAVASASLNGYIAANPGLRGGTGYLTPAGALDSRYAELRHTSDLARSDADQARSLLEQAQLDVAASQAGQDLGFQIIDPPRLPSTAMRQWKKLLIYPAAALIAGILLSTTLLVFLTLGDRAVRTSHELTGAAVPVLGVLPRLRTRRLVDRSGPGRVRRAIYYAAGTTLVSKVGARLRS
jgi:uncharacterized protein involved in exopolysaccharide biosynthesis